MHTLDIAPLRSESPPQKRSGMARVLESHVSDKAKSTITFIANNVHSRCDELFDDL